jgi:hypothetical protein
MVAAGAGFMAVLCSLQVEVAVASCELEGFERVEVPDFINQYCGNGLCMGGCIWP